MANTNAIDDALEIELIIEHTQIKRQSHQSIKTFNENHLDIDTFTFANGFESKQHVMDMVTLLDANGHKTTRSLLITMSGCTEICAFIINKRKLKNKPDKRIAYFKKKCDIQSKIKMMFTMMQQANNNLMINSIVRSITIHPNNQYMAMNYDKVIKIFEIEIRYSEADGACIALYRKNDEYFKLLSNAWSDHEEDKKPMHEVHFGQVVYLGTYDRDNPLNELILVENIKSNTITIHNFITNKLLYQYDTPCNDLYYDADRQCLTIVTGTNRVAMYDIASSTNNAFISKAIFSYNVCSGHALQNKIQIVSVSPNGRYLLTSPRFILHDTERSLVKPFDIYKINDSGKEPLTWCNIRSFGTVQTRQKRVIQFEPTYEIEEHEDDEHDDWLEHVVDRICDNDNDMFYDHNHLNDAVQYDSDMSSRYSDDSVESLFDHLSFDWISDDAFVYVIDECDDGVVHFGELVLVALDLCHVTLEQKQSVRYVVNKEYQLVLHDGIIEFIATFLDGISYFKRINIRDHGYRHRKKAIVCDKNNQLFAVDGQDRSFRFHSYT
eukprot:414645_1